MSNGATPIGPTGPIDPTQPDQGMSEMEYDSIETPKTLPIDIVKPGSEAHTRVLDYMLKRLEDSETRMSQFYSRWRESELKMQAYIRLPEWEQALKDKNKQGHVPKMVSIVIPYTFATVSTVVTYHIQVFTGRKPYNTVSTNKEQFVGAARNQEALIQYNLDHNRYVKWIWQVVQDGMTYGVGAFKIMFVKEQKKRTQRRTTPQTDMMMNELPDRVDISREMTTVYEGNKIESIDPFMLFPDCRVPMAEVNRRGEYVFWRSYEGHHILLRDEAAGVYKYVKDIGDSLPQNKSGGTSARSLVTRGDAHPGSETQTGMYAGKQYKQIDQGTVVLVPSELGIGDSDVPEKYLVTIANKKQIIQLEPFESDHDMHPVAITEPFTVGYGFGQPGLTDYMAPLEDGLSWLFNSHMDSTRRTLHNSFIVDPSMIVMKDVTKNMGPGGLIRLKRQAYGQDVRNAIMQLPVVDVTQGHLKDMEVLFRIGRHISAVDENLMGLQDSGGRKTATEVRVGVEAGASRLATQARLVSSQAIVDMTEQVSLNLQQYLSQEFQIDVLGKDGAMHPINVGNSIGDFTYPIHDGTLPIDRIAMVDLWKEILLAVIQEPMLRQSYSVPKIFEYVAELGGATNIEEFRLQAGSQEQMEQEVQQGDAVPLAEAGNLPGVAPSPMRRLQTALA